jgi:hypothetical protein
VYQVPGNDDPAISAAQYQAQVLKVLGSQESLSSLDLVLLGRFVFLLSN